MCRSADSTPPSGATTWGCYPIQVICAACWPRCVSDSKVRLRGKYQMMRAMIATLMSGLLVLSAQPPQPQQASQTPPPAAAKGVVKFGATTQLVVVDVTVKDKSGNPIKGLKPADFNITEDGKKQDIKIFTFQELEETVNPEPVPAKAVAPAPKSQDAPSTPAAPVVKSVTANQIAPSKPGEVKYKDRRLLVM